ncbi:MAG: site-2 protease family protein, partial [Phycisphaerae bacterium]
MSRSLDNPINWSLGVGSLFGIRIRVHLLFVLGGLVIVFHNLGDGGGWRGLGYGLGSIGLLFLIVLLHEFGHCFGARYAGGQADEILMWPLGGLAYTSPPHNPRAHLITVIAGPAVNVVLLLITSVFLVSWKGTWGALPSNPFKPFYTDLPWVPGSLYYWLVVFFTLNLIILLFNLAPVFPFDGGRILQCLLWFRKGFIPATLIATGVGMVGAIVIGIIGLATAEVLFFAIAFFGYFTCWQQRQMIRSGMYETGNEFGYDFSQGYTSLDQNFEGSAKRPSFWERRRAAKEAARAAREARLQEERRREVDRVLDKVHNSGVESLTA